MSTVDRRTDPLTGQPVVVVHRRQERPNLPTGDCPFCPGGIEAPDPYEVRWFVNRWPPEPDDRCEVVLYSPRHDAAFWELGAEGARRVVELWAARTASLGARADVGYVMPFENRGREVGATIAHPHGQIYALTDVPPAPAAELTSSTSCACCDAPSDDLVVDAVGSVRTWVPHAASWPFELRIAPAGHVPDLPAGGPALHADLGAALARSLARLDRLVDAPMPYMLWVHQRPTDGGAWPTAHVHVHVAPLWRAPGVPRFVAAGELGSGVYYNPVVPEDAARRLRELDVEIDA